MRFRNASTVLICLLAMWFAIACAPAAEEEAPAEETPAMEEHAEEETSGGPRVWFVTPEDGATVTSPVKLEFSSENIKIEPKGDVHAGAGHHHIGLDTECLPPGEAIPEADPWVHLGDASSSMEMQLPPGEHTLTLQIGDGEHVTLDEPGLCTTITINVVEEQ